MLLQGLKKRILFFGKVREAQFLDLRDGKTNTVFIVFFAVRGDDLLRAKREQRRADGENIRSELRRIDAGDFR